MHTICRASLPILILGAEHRRTQRRLTCCIPVDPLFGGQRIGWAYSEQEDTVYPLLYQQFAVAA